MLDLMSAHPILSALAVALFAAFCTWHVAKATDLARGVVYVLLTIVYLPKILYDMWKR